MTDPELRERLKYEFTSEIIPKLYLKMVDWSDEKGNPHVLDPKFMSNIFEGLNHINMTKMFEL